MRLVPPYAPSHASVIVSPLSDWTAGLANCLPTLKYFPSSPTACFLLLPRPENNVAAFRMTLTECACVCLCVHDGMHAWDPPTWLYACVHATRQPVRVGKHEHNVLQCVWAQAGTIADCLVCFLFFFSSFFLLLLLPSSLFHVHVVTTIRFSS